MNKIKLLSRVRNRRKIRRKIKNNKVFTLNEELTEKFRKWYANGGREHLDSYMERADKAIRELEKAREIDWSTLHKPMTI